MIAYISILVDRGVIVDVSGHRTPGDARRHLGEIALDTYGAPKHFPIVNRPEVENGLAWLHDRVERFAIRIVEVRIEDETPRIEVIIPEDRGSRT